VLGWLSGEGERDIIPGGVAGAGYFSYGRAFQLQFVVEATM